MQETNTSPTQPEDPDVDAIIDDLINGDPSPKPKAIDPISARPSFMQTHTRELQELAPGERGFLGAQYVTGEDGSLMRDGNNRPVKFTDAQDQQKAGQQHQDANPFTD